MKDAQGNGRVQLLGVCLPHDVILVIANVYGWTGGSRNEGAAGRTSDMLEAILTEFSVLPSGPKIILGDINADLDKSPPLQAAIDRNDLVDLESHATFGHPCGMKMRMTMKPL